MLKSVLVAAGLLVAGLSFSAAPASATPLGHGAASAAETAAPLVETVQYYGRRRGWGGRRFYGPRPYYGRRFYGPRRFYGGPRPFYGRPYGYGPRPFYRGYY